MTYSPWRTLRALPHLTLLVTRLPKGRAWWMPDDDGIVLDDRLDRVERRCALEHELQHAAADDRHVEGTPDARRLNARQERAADERAARRLIDLDDLADALVWALSVDEIADLLDVTPAVARVRVLGLTPDEKAAIDTRIRRLEGAA